MCDSLAFLYTRIIYAHTHASMKPVFSTGASYANGRADKLTGSKTGGSGDRETDILKVKHAGG